MMSLSEAPQTQLFPFERIVVLLSCALSFLGSGLLVGTHALWPELRTRPRQLLLYLSLADLLSAASYFYGVLMDFGSSSWDCVAQGALSTFANTSSFFWTMAVALYLYLTIVQGSASSSALLCFFHVVRFVPSSFLFLPPKIEWFCTPNSSRLPFYEGREGELSFLGASKEMGGFSEESRALPWHPNLEACTCPTCVDPLNVLVGDFCGMLFLGLIPQILGFHSIEPWKGCQAALDRSCPLSSLHLLLVIICHKASSPSLSKHAALSEYRPILSRATDTQPRTSVADKKLVLIPVIFIFLRIWSTIRFVLTLCGSPAVQNPLLVVLHGIGNTFQGGANCIMFVFCTRVVRNKLLSSWCCWWREAMEDSLPSPESRALSRTSSLKDWGAQDTDRERAELPST
nr:G-protein coupled receptor 157 [Anolis sagrei ordinatus]